MPEVVFFEWEGGIRDNTWRRVQVSAGLLAQWEALEVELCCCEGAGRDECPQHADEDES